MMTERERVAIHEAAHTCAGWLLGRRPDWVTIVPGPDFGGRAAFLRASGGPVVIPAEKPPGFPIIGMNAHSRRTAEVALLIKLAGPTAVELYCPPGTETGGGYVGSLDDDDFKPNDESGAFELAFWQGPGSEAQLIAYMRSRVRVMLVHPLAVALLSAVRDALLERETLTGTEVRRLLRETERAHNQRLGAGSSSSVGAEALQPLREKDDQTP